MAKREIYTQRLRAGKRIYYFDICESSGERLYIKVSERKRTGANTQEHHRLIIYPEDLEDFCDELNDLVEEFRERFNDGAELERREALEGPEGGPAGPHAHFDSDDDEAGLPEAHPFAPGAPHGHGAGARHSAPRQNGHLGASSAFRPAPADDHVAYRRRDDADSDRA